MSVFAQGVFVLQIPARRRQHFGYHEKRVRAAILEAVGLTRLLSSPTQFPGTVSIDNAHHVYVHSICIAS